MKKTAIRKNMKTAAYLTSTLFAALLVFTPVREANAAGIGLSLNIGRFSLGVGIGGDDRPCCDPAPATYVEQPAPQPVVVEQPAPQPIVVEQPAPQPIVVEQPAPQPIVVKQPAPRTKVVSPTPVVRGQSPDRARGPMVIRGQAQDGPNNYMRGASNRGGYNGSNNYMRGVSNRGDYGGMYGGPNRGGYGTPNGGMYGDPNRGGYGAPNGGMYGGPNRGMGPRF